MNVDYPEIVVQKATSYMIPDEIADDIDFVLGIDNFPTVSPQYGTCVKRKPFLAGNFGVTPPTILQSYNISSYESSSPGNSQAVASFLNQYFKPSDLRQFQEHYDVPSNPIDKIVGENNDERPGLEASLDVQYITGVGRKVATWYCKIGQTATQTNTQVDKYTDRQTDRQSRKHERQGIELKSSPKICFYL